MRSASTTNCAGVWRVRLRRYGDQVSTGGYAQLAATGPPTETLCEVDSTDRVTVRHTLYKLLALAGACQQRLPSSHCTHRPSRELDFWNQQARETTQCCCPAWSCVLLTRSVSTEGGGASNFVHQGRWRHFPNTSRLHVLSTRHRVHTHARAHIITRLTMRLSRVKMAGIFLVLSTLLALTCPILLCPFTC